MAQLYLDLAPTLRRPQARELPFNQEDLGYVVHQALAELFGPGTVQPFRVEGWSSRRDPGIKVLAYTGVPAEDLRRRADAFAEPLAHSRCLWQDLRTKPMPEIWREGQVLGFKVRICPVVRLSSGAELVRRSGITETLQEGAELDAWLHQFLSNRSTAAEALSREAVYSNWLRGRMAPAAEVVQVSMTAFRRVRLVRKDRSSPRRSRIVERPDAELSGLLRITSPQPFRTLLERGVGRHRAFGFGMLLLRHASHAER